MGPRSHGVLVRCGWAVTVPAMTKHNTDTVWYHGTSAALTAGDTLVPGASVARSNFDDGDPDPDWQTAKAFAQQRVWVTPNADEAAYYAANASVQCGGTPRIYEVQPLGDPQRAEGHDGHHCDRATVIATFDDDSARIAAEAAADMEPDPDWILAAFGLEPAAV